MFNYITSRYIDSSFMEGGGPGDEFTDSFFGHCGRCISPDMSDPRVVRILFESLLNKSPLDPQHPQFKELLIASSRQLSIYLHCCIGLVLGILFWLLWSYPMSLIDGRSYSISILLLFCTATVPYEYWLRYSPTAYSKEQDQKLVGELAPKAIQTHAQWREEVFNFVTSNHEIILAAFNQEEEGIASLCLLHKDTLIQLYHIASRNHENKQEFKAWFALHSRINK